MLTTDSRNFLEAVWGLKADDHKALLWLKRGDEKISLWCDSAGEACDRIGERMGQYDIYVGCAFSAIDKGPSQRTNNDDAAGIAGLWVDIDVRSEFHQAKALPATIEAALSILPAGFPPSLVVRSGNGLHAWWLFREGWVFETSEEREGAAKLIRRWQALMRANAAARGWVLDHTHDLARVLRCPGTLNHKSDPPKPVELYSEGGARYNPSDFEEALDSAGVPHDFKAARMASGSMRPRSEFILHAEASIDPGLLERLLEVSPKFRATWHRHRWDLNNGDPSQSHYDLALANFGLDAGLPEQIIINLMIQHRRDNPDPKARRKLRGDYYARTLDIAYEKGYGAVPVAMLPEFEAPASVIPTRDASPEAGGEHAPAPPAEPATAPPAAQATPAGNGAASPPPPQAAPDKPKAAAQEPRKTPPMKEPPKKFAEHGTAVFKAEMCEQLSQALEVKIVRVSKICGKEPTYHIDLERGPIELSTLEKLVDQTALRNAIAKQTNRMFRRFRTKEWDGVRQWLMDAIVDIDGGMESDFQGAMRSDLDSYLKEVEFIRPDEQDPGIQFRPMIIDGAVAITILDLRKWGEKRGKAKTTETEIRGALVAIGAISKDTNINKLRQTRWILPEEWAPIYFDSARNIVTERAEAYS